jgi:hypothetical protein
MKHTAFLTICGSEGQKGKNEGKVKGVPSFVICILPVLLRGKNRKNEGPSGKNLPGECKASGEPFILLKSL